MIPQPLLSSDTSSLLYITNLNPWYHGLAPFSARAILGIEVDYISGSSTNRESPEIESKENPDIFIYPNPGSGILRINSSDTIEQVFVYNIQGNLILTAEGSTVDLNQMKNGLYFVQIRTTRNLKTLTYELAR